MLPIMNPEKYETPQPGWTLIQGPGHNWLLFYQGRFIDWFPTKADALCRVHPALKAVEHTGGSGD